MQSPESHAPIRDLIAARIRSIEEVDVLRAVRSSHRALRAQELARSTGLHADDVVAALSSLLTHGFVVRRGESYLYCTSSLEVDGTVEELEYLNRSDRAELLALLSRTAVQRVRADFAELFTETLRSRRIEKE